MPKRACTVLAMDINQTTATKVAAAITTTGNTVAGVSSATLIPRTTLQRKLAGNAELTLTEVHKIAVAIGLRTRDLLPAELIEQDAA